MREGKPLLGGALGALCIISLFVLLSLLSVHASSFMLPASSLLESDPILHFLLGCMYKQLLFFVIFLIELFFVCWGIFLHAASFLLSPGTYFMRRVETECKRLAKQLLRSGRIKAPK